MPVRLQASFGQVAEERQCGGADRAEIRDVAGPGKLIGGGVGDGDILIETRQWGVEAAGEPESPVEEYALGIADMIQQFADGPFIRRVAVERFFLRDAGEEPKRGFELRFEGGDDIVAGDAIDVSGVVRRGFSGRGASGH